MAVESAASFDGTWVLASISGQPVAVGNSPRFTIEGDAISGFDGCNQFGGQLADPESMRVGQRACAGDYVHIPLDLSDPKSHLDEAVLNQDRLSLPARKELPASEFVRQ